MSSTSPQNAGNSPSTATSSAMPASLSDVVERVLSAANSNTVTIGEVSEAVGRASFTPILLLPAVAVATPLSGIPLFSALMGIIICLVSSQMLLRREKLWLPGWVLQREVEGQRVKDAFQYIQPAARWLDDRADKRFGIVTRRPLVFVPQLICFLSGLLMPLLEFIPFSSSIMGIGVACLAFGMLTRDGLIVLIGLIPYAVVTGVVLS